MGRGEYGRLYVGNGVSKPAQAALQSGPQSSGIPWVKIAIGAAVVGVGYLVLVRPSIKAGDRRLAEARQLATDVGLKYGMTEEEKDRAFDTYYKKKGYPSYLLSTAPKWTT